MDETPGLSEQYRTASPWPIFVALGLTLAELGILFDLFALAVGGLILFSGSVAGMLTESGYVASPWWALGGLSALLLAVGLVFVFTDVQFVTRGYAVLAAAAMLLVGAVGGALYTGWDKPAV